MAQTIWKFPLEVTDEQVLAMPTGARLLHVGVQSGKVCLWAQVDQDAPEKRHRTIRILGTGHPMPDAPGGYVGTFMLRDGALVFHVYDST